MGFQKSGWTYLKGIQKSGRTYSHSPANVTLNLSTRNYNVNKIDFFKNANTKRRVCKYLQYANYLKEIGEKLRTQWEIWWAGQINLVMAECYT